MQHINQTWWIHKNVGKEIRRVAPSCEPWSIRDEFFESGNHYVIYEEGD